MMKSTLRIITAAIFAVLFACGALSGEDLPLDGLDRVESILYGQPQSGGMLNRLSKAEAELFGMELPGSLTERLQGMKMFVEDGTAAQPSLLFKMSVAEWVTHKRVYTVNPLTERVANLETTLEGDAKSGALSTRIENLAAKLLPGGISANTVNLSAATVFKAVFTDTVTVRNVKAGDKIYLEADEDCIVDGTIAVAKGNRLLAEVTKVKLPRSFGRSSEIQIDFKSIETFGGITVPVSIGSEAKKAMEVDSGMIGAAGASVAGLVAFGPLGLVGGALVRGNDKQIQQGTYVYVETAEGVNTPGYTAPAGLNFMQGAADSAPQQDGAVEYSTTDGAVPAADDGADATVY